MKWKKLAVAATVPVIALALYFGLRSQSSNAPATTLPAPRYIAAEGKLEALPGAEMEVGSELIARIERFNAGEGEHVEQGQVIAVLDSKDLLARLKQAEAELAVAKARHAEVAAGARKQEIKQAQAALQRAQAE